MNLIFADHPMPLAVTRSLFLAGPSPREKSVTDWRLEALALLAELEFDGEVFIPIPEARFYGGDDSQNWTYDHQVDWECKARHVADQIVFWVPREIANGMPGFTTNVEFGEDLSSGKIVYGRPANAEKCRYLDKRIEGIGLPVHDSLALLLSTALRNLGAGAERTLGEVNVPLFIWRTPQFKSWYRQLRAANNRLDDAKLLDHFRLPNGVVLSFTLSVNVWIEAEQRHKSNEFIIARRDVCSVLAFYRDEEALPDSAPISIVLVKEFRSPGSNPHGYVFELPGGSADSDSEVDPRSVAQQELHEETGLVIEDLNRFRLCGDAQVNATVSTYRAQVYAVELSKDEFLGVQAVVEHAGTFGASGTSERTTVELLNVDKLWSVPLDFATLGMIHTALCSQ